MTRNPPAISAHANHSAHAKSGTIQTYRDAVATNANYVELDIRRTADQELVAFHDSRTRQGTLVSAIGYSALCELAGFDVPKVAEVFAAIKAGGAKGHLDLKETGCEDRLTLLALDILGPGGFVIYLARRRVRRRHQRTFSRPGSGAGRALPRPTVNNEREIRYWLARARADVLITDRPAAAMAIRADIPYGLRATPP